MKVKVHMYYLLILGAKCLIQQIYVYTKTTRDLELFISLFAQKGNHACQHDGQARLLQNQSECVHVAISEK